MVSLRVSMVSEENEGTDHACDVYLSRLEPSLRLVSLGMRSDGRFSLFSKGYFYSILLDLEKNEASNMRSRI